MIREVGDAAREGQPAAGSIAAPGPEAAPGADAGDPVEWLYRETITAIQARPRRTWPFILALSVVAFVAVSSGGLAIERALQLTAVLLLHEIGHFVAMRLLGYADVRMFFIPMFGALTTGESTEAATWKDAVVTLAGPVPGIVLGGLLLLSPSSPTFLARTLLYVNAFNLLPIAFLDGGRLLGKLFWRDRPVVETMFGIASGVALIAWAASTSSLSFAILGALVVSLALGTHRVARAAIQLRALLVAVPGGLRNLPESQLRPLFDVASRLSTSMHVRPRSVASMMRALYERATALSPSVAQKVGFTSAWFVALSLAAVLGARQLNGPAARWTVVRDTERGFAVELPGAPRNLSPTAFTVDLGSRVYRVEVLPGRQLPGTAETREDAGRILAGWAARLSARDPVMKDPLAPDPMAARLEATLKSGHRLTLEGHFGHGAFFALMTIDASRGNTYRAEADRFFSSFRTSGSDGP